MVTTTKSILELTAEDVMSRDVITIAWNMSLRAAAHELAQANVSGAPVTDDHGRCIGVLSTTDLVRWLDRLQGLPADAVHLYMTTGVVKAALDTPVTTLARWMVDAHIHRVVVTDERNRPVGVVSSTDILAAVAAHREGGERRLTGSPGTL
jgi:CBS-domain-containing membrane protein